MTISRIKTETAITRIREAVSPNTIISWNPETNDGQIIFRVEDLITENGVAVGLLPNDALRTKAADGVPEIRRNISELLQRTVTVQTGAESTATVPLVLVMLALKKVFDELYVEDLDLQNAPPASVPPRAKPDGWDEMVALRQNRLRNVEQ